MKKAQVILILIALALVTEFQAKQLSVLDATQAIAAEDIPTTSTIHPNRSVVWSGETLQFTIHVVTKDRQGVELGLVTLSDLNASWSQDYPLQSGSNGKLIVVVDIVSVSLEGKHVWKVDYQGYVPASYLPSSATTIVEFLSEAPSGTEPCDVTVDLGTGSVFTNDSFGITVNVTRDSGAPPFYGGNLAIAVPTEDIVLTSYIIPNGFYLDLSVTLAVPIPLWFSPGLTEMIVNFTDTKDYFMSASEPFAIDVLDLGHDLALTVTPVTINREDDTVTIRVAFEGDNATGKTLQVGWTDEVNNWTIATQRVSSNPEVILWTVNYSFTPGSYLMWAEVQAPGEGTVYAAHNQSVTLFDYVALDWTVNDSAPAPGDTVEFSFTCSEEDIPTSAVPSRILITDSTEGLIGNVTTNTLGLVDFLWEIPRDTLGGAHSLNFTVIPLDPNAGFVQQMFWDTLLVQGQTLLQLSYPAQIQRGQSLDISYQLSIEGQNPVTEGEIYFTPPYDPVQIQQVNAAGNGVFTLSIALDHPVGLHSFSISYAGTPAFSSAEETIDISILSEPHFSTLHINASPVLPGQTLRIFGQLLDEADTGVPEQSILFYLSETINIGTTTTQVDGSFACSWIVPVNATTGLNLLSAEFPGNFSAGYLAPLNQPVTTAVLISNDIALEVSASVIANASTMLKIHGGFGTNVSIWWQAEGSAEWQLIMANLSISSIAIPYELPWTVPTQRGPITLRMTNNLNLTVFATTIAYAAPQYTFPTDLALNVDENYLLNASCSATYRILVDGIPVTAWQTTPASIPVAFALRGLHTVTMEISEAYVLNQTITVNVSVYEPVKITLQVPSDIPASMTALIEITMTSALPGGGPLSGKNIVVSVYDLTHAVTIAEYSIFLDAAGKKLIETDVLARGSYEVEVQLLSGQDWYAPASESVIFHAVGQAALEFILPPTVIFNESVILSATLHETQGPISEKKINFWVREEGNGWIFLGENATAATGEAQISWIPLLPPGQNYSLKAELKLYPDLEPTSVIKPIIVMTYPPAIITTYSSLNPSNGTLTIAPGDYEIVVEIQEKSPLDYEVSFLVNGEETLMTRIDNNEYLFQAGNEAYWISTSGTILYVGTFSCFENGVYNVTIKTEDKLGAKSTLNLGSFVITPPTILEVWSLLPDDNSTSVARNHQYSIVVQVQEHSHMDYFVYLVINGQRTEMILNQGDGYTLQAPNGTFYFIPANGTLLFVGQIVFSTNGAYNIAIVLEDERGITQHWKVGILEVAVSDDAIDDNASSGDAGAKDDETGGISSFSVVETALLFLFMAGSSGTVVFMGKPRRNKF
ncbi:MAG: hypothetical protein ACFFB3_02620 [Candidatus Hodarchaeota archaeon]